MVKVLATIPVVIRSGTFPGANTYPGANAYPGRGTTLATKAA
jgi:hypothetical protein